MGYDGSTFDPDGDRTPIIFEADPAVAYSINSNLGFDLGQGRSLRLVGNYNRRDVEDVYTPVNGIYRQRFADAMREEDIIDDPFDENYNVTLSYEQADFLGSRLKLEGFYYDFERKQGGLSFAPNVDLENNEWWGVRSSLTTPLEFLRPGAAATYGFDFSRNDFFRPGFDRDTGEFAFLISPDVWQESYAGFFQLDVPVGDFLLTGGVRHEEFRGKAKSGLKNVETGKFFQAGDVEDFDLTLFNAGLVYSLTDNTELFAGFSQGAEITQLGRAAAVADSADQIKPEPAKSNSYEIGARGHWGNTEASFAAFYTESDLISDLQAVEPTPENPRGFLIPLREPREIWGAEITLDYQFNQQWGVGGIVAWQDGQRENTDTGATEELGADVITTPQTTLRVNYAPFPWWRNTLQGLYIFERDAGVEGFDGPIDNDLILDFLAEFDALGGKLSLGVENLLNHEYASVSSQAFNGDFFWFPQEGTRVTLVYRFEW